MSPSRRRAVAMLALALTCGALAASKVSGTVRDVEARTGKPIAVLVAARSVRPDAEVTPADLALRLVPARYAPADALSSAREVVGTRSVAGLARGAYVTASSLGGTRPGIARDGTLRRGERAVEVAVTGGAPLSAATPGTRVDVLVSTEPRDGGGRSFVALEDVELLALDGAPSSDTGAGSGGAGAGAGSGGGNRATNTATLRVTLRQAVYLTAAQNFAREVRLLPRPAGDRGSAGRAGVAAAGL